jgi:hypothetical protein
MSDEDATDLAPRDGRAPEARDRRRPAGADTARPGTNGAQGGMGGRDFRTGLIFIVVVSLAAVSVNALTVQADRPNIEPWKPWVWEGTSLVALLILAWLPWVMSRRAPPDVALEGGWRSALPFAGVHLAALLAFSAIHVTAFVFLRHVAYGLAGEGPYPFGGLLDRFVYELRKDGLTYASWVAVFWIARRLREAGETKVRPVSFDIRDGARIIRAPLDDILAVTSAGNYVEVLLADGRRPLMRATLAAVEVELERFGFVRVHRSWLVNTGRVTGLRPEGSGDWTVELGPVEAPVSRRFPDALARLKA